jgi:magnesium transporter
VAEGEVQTEEDPIRSVLLTGSDDDVRMFLATLSPQETADLLETVPDDLRERLFPLLDLKRQATVLREVEGDELREDLVESIPDERLADIAEAQRTDDATDLLSDLTEERRERVLEEIHPDVREDIEELVSYPHDSAGGIMQKELMKLRADLTVREAIEEFRAKYDRKIGDTYDIYVVDDQDHVLGRVRNRHLLINPPDRPLREFMREDVRTVPVTMDQERIAEIVKDYDLASVAVLDEHGRLVGRILVDDIVDVIQEEATEDIQKLGGTEALEEPYLTIRLRDMVKKRAGWLAALFLSEMLTASAMANYQGEIERATILAMFIPLIISSGGNSGSQATSLVIRAMALGEVKLRDWWRVMRRELTTGLMLGLLLGTIGVVRIFLWQWVFTRAPEPPPPPPPPSDGSYYGPHYELVALTVGVSLVGIVLWGSIAGSMLPFLLRKLGFDPASASAPFVATLVDVTGIMIYFTVAYLFLKGTML